MGTSKEVEPSKRIARNQGEDSTGPPRTNTGQSEKPQPRMIRQNDNILKVELSIYQAAADGLTQAGLGTYKFSVAEQQIGPYTGEPIGEDSPFVVVTYSGLEDRNMLWDLVHTANGARQQLERERKPKEEIDQAVQDAIKTGIDTNLKREAHF